MADFTLSAEMRSIQGKKVSQLRKQGVVPGALYGPNTDPIKLQFQYRDLETTLRNAGGTNLIDINVDGDKNYPVLAREVQRDIIKGNILHVDFFAVDMNIKIRAEIPLVYEGQSPLVVSRLGIMLTGPNSLTVEMLPSRLMNQIVVDVSGMEEIGDTISVKDLVLDDVTIINEPEEMIAKIVQPSAARAEEALEALELAEGAEGEEGEESDDE
ncbi:MAG: 50S ribosomal protein L25 [Anaerolineae bacterium]|nr:50S ribosomal protein L25 [Anaerolineae bacterium]MDQ7036205.1 50S ribosomal protein L25 [Anaerolineae bacterium]